MCRFPLLAEEDLLDEAPEDLVCAPEVDADPRAAYFRQAHNGLHIRMALLNLLMS